MECPSRRKEKSACLARFALHCSLLKHGHMRQRWKQKNSSDSSNYSLKKVIVCEISQLLFCFLFTSALCVASLCKTQNRKWCKGFVVARNERERYTTQIRKVWQTNFLYLCMRRSMFQVFEKKLSRSCFEMMRTDVWMSLKDSFVMMTSSDGFFSNSGNNRDPLQTKKKNLFIVNNRGLYWY